MLDDIWGTKVYDFLPISKSITRNDWSDEFWVRRFAVGMNNSWGDGTWLVRRITGGDVNTSKNGKPIHRL